MKRIILIFLIGIFCRTNAAEGDFATTMLEATFKLFHVNSTGTCVLVRRAAPDPSLYLVTAAHVVERTKGDTAIIVLRERTADRFYQRRDHTIHIRRDGKPLWVRHDKEDVAVLRLEEKPPIPVGVLPMTSLADEAGLNATGLHICSSLFVLTYPQRFEANEAGFAVARHGIIASHSLIATQRLPTFVADLPTLAADRVLRVLMSGKAGHSVLCRYCPAPSQYV